MRTRYLALILLLLMLAAAIPALAQDDTIVYTHDAEVIENAEARDLEEYLDPVFEAYVEDYYSPCRGGTDAVIFSWHGMNRDDRPPFDPGRQAIHFYCQDRDLYAPHDGVVWDTTMRFGGLIFIDDADNGTCMVLLGMESIDEAITEGAEISTGDYLGKYMYKLHLAVTKGDCADTGWYDPEARKLEVPIAYIEMGGVLRNDLREADAVPFVSQNPGGTDEPDSPPSGGDND